MVSSLVTIIGRPHYRQSGNQLPRTAELRVIMGTDRGEQVANAKWPPIGVTETALPDASLHSWAFS
jgi:hypothetical protein